MLTIPRHLHLTKPNILLPKFSANQRYFSNDGDLSNSAQLFRTHH
jgi:hypothetical protein